ncbi:MAG: hypothetical protein RIT14_351 [Pseudomonadota bacterium]
MHRALLLATPTLITAAALRAWFAAGNTIAELWCAEPDNPFLHPPRSLAGNIYPEFDAVRLIRAAGVPVRRIPPLRRWPDALAEARASGADTLMTVMTLQIVPADLIAHFGDRAVNLHPALLPDYKGPGARHGMLLDGTADRFGGITLHRLTAGIDEGPIIAQRPCPRSAARDIYDWDHQLAQAGAGMIRHELQEYLAGRRAAVAQTGQGSYRRLAPDERLLTPDLSLASLRLRCERLGPSRVLRWQAGGRSASVLGLDRSLGAPTGDRPRVTPFAVEADIADARVRLRRKSPLSQAADLWARLAAMRRMRAQLRAGGDA